MKEKRKQQERRKQNTSEKQYETYFRFDRTVEPQTFQQPSPYQEVQTVTTYGAYEKPI